MYRNMIFFFMFIIIFKWTIFFTVVSFNFYVRTMKCTDMDELINIIQNVIQCGILNVI